MKSTTPSQFKTMTFNLEAGQARQLRALHQLTNLSLSDMAREAFRAYLKGTSSASLITSQTIENTKVG